MATQFHKIPAQALLSGDQVGSGENVVSVSAGVRPPRGKVEVILAKNGHRRLSIWRASTVITAQRNVE